MNFNGLERERKVSFSNFNNIKGKSFVLLLVGTFGTELNKGRAKSENFPIPQ